jgi:PhzF family phenazine biosynthesis protein
MPVPFYWVDAFTDGPFSGNPAGVCILDAPAPVEWMQQVATEIGLSETAFVTPGRDTFLLRWFTPSAEVDLCGHATLATAHSLWHAGRLDPGHPARFGTRSGVLTAVRQRGPAGDLIWLDFPATPPEKTTPPAGLLDALGLLRAEFVGRSRFDYVVEVDGEGAVRACRPDFKALGSVAARGVVITARATQYDFISRFFAPSVGVNEDPATGSSHCALAPYWAERLRKTELVAKQLSPRGGLLHLEVKGSRVHLGGQSHLLIEGSLTSEPERSQWPELS